MVPNPQDALPLPPRPDLENLRRRARHLVKVCRSGGDVQSWATRWVNDLVRLASDPVRPSPRDADRLARDLAGFAHARMTAAGCTLSQAQFVIARAHGFPSWPKLVHHVESLTVAGSPASTFERAADAIVAGDVETLDRLLAEQPDLVHARSGREHGATLLHYVSANGVENFRQRTPPNIVAIARTLLDAGAAVDAEADVYGGGARTLGLVVTSAHPRLAGVQNTLADLLLERGARLDPGIVRDCLMNGCPEAAAHLVERGAPVRSLQDAAGIGSPELVARWFEPPHAPSPGEAAAALVMASWYDHRAVVTFMLDRGVDVAGRDPTDGQTALHVAAYQGHVELVSLLLARRAPVDVTDERYGTPPLVWALHAWLVDGRPDDDRYRAVIRALADAGAAVKPAWIDDDRLRADGELFAILSARAAAP